MSSTLPRILVVDDEPRAVELLVRSLRKQAEMDTAQSGEEALARFEGGGFSLKSVERTLLCGRGVAEGGLCV